MNRASAVAFVLLVGCYEEKPEISRWDACWHDGASMADVEGVGTIGPGQDAVLRLWESWGYLGRGSVDSGFYSSLWIELPAQPEADVALSLSDRPGRYLQSMAFGIEFSSDTLVGEATFLRSNDRTLTWKIEGEAIEPSTDLGEDGTMLFSGRVVADRGDVDGCDD